MHLALLKKICELLKPCKCPICGNRFDEYLEAGTSAKVWKDLHGVGAGTRKALCPYCKCFDRDRLVYLYFRDIYIPNKKHEQIKMLHIAPEKVLTRFFSNLVFIDYTAADKRCEGYNYPDYVKDIDLMDLSNIADNTYDVIICNHVLEHVDNDIDAMKSLFRILKTDGVAILQVPYVLKLQNTLEEPSAITPETHFELYGQKDHVRLYGLDYPNRLKKAGFEVDALEIASKYPKKYGLNPEEKLFVCHKVAF